MPDRVLQLAEVVGDDVEVDDQVGGRPSLGEEVADLLGGHPEVLQFSRGSVRRRGSW
jgi:hypothetical protein